MNGEGKEGKALLVYQNPKANWASYDKVMLDPVTVWMGAGSQMVDVSPEDQQQLATLFYIKIKDALQADYKFVSAPRPGVLERECSRPDAPVPAPHPGR